MDRLKHKQMTTSRRADRVRAIIQRTASTPRLSVHISNRHVLAQIIDNQSGKSLVYVSTSAKGAPKGNLTQKASWVGEQVAAAAKKVKIKRVVFDRGGRKYHGRLKALAEAARAGGMEF